MYTDYKATSWIDEEFCLLIQVKSWDHLFDNLVNHIIVNLFIANFWVVLS